MLIKNFLYFFLFLFTVSVELSARDPFDKRQRSIKKETDIQIDTKENLSKSTNEPNLTTT